MYELSTAPFGPYRRYDIQDPATGHGFSLAPAKGATLLDLRFAGKSVLDGYQTPDELSAGKWGKSAVLFPFPNRLRDGHYTWDGREYLFPINNADTGNAIHGFARGETFEVVRVELTTEDASIACRLDYDGRHAGYPFPCTLDLVFSISNRNDFSVSFFLKNRHDKAIPAGFGWHPYFRLAERADDHTLQLPPCEKIGIDDRMIPTGARSAFPDFETEKKLAATSLDNCFRATSAHLLYRLHLSAAGRRLMLVASEASFPFFQIFTPPHRQSVALEPMTCNVDAFRNGDGLVSVPPGGDWTAAFRIEYYDLQD